MTDCTLLYVPVVMSHRDSNHTEIDILIKENEQLTAIEVIYHIILIMKKILRKLPHITSTPIAYIAVGYTGDLENTAGYIQLL